VQNALFYSLVAMCSLFAASTWCLSRPHLLSSAAAAVASVLWVLMNGPLEGRVLYSVTPENGLTESDLLSAVGLCIAIWGFRTWRRNLRVHGRSRPVPRIIHPDGSRAAPTAIRPRRQDDVSAPERRAAQ